MEAAPPPPRPPCGLTRQEVLALDERNRVPVVGGRCQNPYDDAAGVEHKCGRTVGAHPSETASAGSTQATATAPAEFEAVIEASLIISLDISVSRIVTKNRKRSTETITETQHGSAVAISATMAVTALHGKATIGHPVSLRDHHGNNFVGKVAWQQFNAQLVDIAVIRLDNAASFNSFMPWSEEPSRLTQTIYVVGLKYNSIGDGVAPYARQCNVDLIETAPDSALIQASYYNFDGCSGTGVVTAQTKGKFVVVGVHVGSHSDSRIAGQQPIKKRARSGPIDLEGSILSTVHGHTSYSLICEIARVPDLISFLRKSQTQKKNQKRII